MKKFYKRGINVSQAFVCFGNDFVGFEICNFLLEEGWNVYSLESQLLPHEMKWAEEKRLFVGRNGNFHAIDSERTEQAFFELDKPYLLFLPLHDLYIRNQSITSYQWLLEHFLNHPPDKIVMIIPKRKYDYWKEDQKSIQKIADASNEQYVFFVPTLFGKYQPHLYLFAQSKYRDNDKLQNHIDDVSDAIYIKDLLSVVYQQLEKGTSGEYIIQNAKKNYWKEIAQQFFSNEMIEKFLKDEVSIDLRVKNVLTVHPSHQLNEIIDNYQSIYQSLINLEND